MRVAGVDTQGGDAGLNGGESQTIVEVDVGDKRQGALGNELRQGLGGGLVGDGHAEDVAPKVVGTADLSEDGGDVGGRDVCHRLNRDGGATANLHGTDMNRTSLGTKGHGRSPQKIRRMESR